jgi:nucleoside 2-deoxyribosyltransferase
MKKIYLAGTMSSQKNFGEEWRSNLVKWFSKYGRHCFNPCTEEIKFHKHYKIKAQNKQDWEKLPQILQEKIIKADLKQIKKSKYVICYFTKYSTGTVSEITFAYFLNIPIYFVASRSMKKWPGTVARSKRNKVFNDFESLKRYLAIKYKMRKK